MVYHRSFLYYYIFNGFFRGVIGGGLLKVGSLHKLVQFHTDGAIARILYDARVALTRREIFCSRRPAHNGTEV